MDITVTNKETKLDTVASGEDILRMRTLIRDIPIAEAVQEFALGLSLGLIQKLDIARKLPRNIF